MAVIGDVGGAHEKETIGSLNSLSRQGAIDFVSTEDYHPHPRREGDSGQRDIHSFIRSVLTHDLGQQPSRLLYICVLVYQVWHVGDIAYADDGKQ